ncbi:hypothetical protein STEG23_011469 [Scotinomys teguina]
MSRGLLEYSCSGWLFQLSLEVPPPLMFPMTVTPLVRDQDCSLKNREPDVPALLVPGSRKDEVQSNRSDLAPTSRIQEPREPGHPAYYLAKMGSKSWKQRFGLVWGV